MEIEQMALFLRQTILEAGISENAVVPILVTALRQQARQNSSIYTEEKGQQVVASGAVNDWYFLFQEMTKEEHEDHIRKIRELVEDETFGDHSVRKETHSAEAKIAVPVEDDDEGLETWH